MEYTTLGRTGLSVSRLCLGTMNFGKQADQITAFRILDQARDAGINLFDTANVYGHAIVGPRTLEQLGDALLALDLDLDSNTLGRLNELFPGYRTAPEDFAW